MNNKKEKNLDEDGLVVRENKEASKREREETKAFVKLLLKLPSSHYKDLLISENLEKALVEGKRLTNNALKRHLSYLARLILAEGADRLILQYERVSHPYRNDIGKINQVKNYKERLLNNDEQIIQDILNRFANVDVQRLRQLVRNTKKEITKRNELNDKAVLEGKRVCNKMTKSENLLVKFLSSLHVQSN